MSREMGKQNTAVVLRRDWIRWTFYVRFPLSSRVVFDVKVHEEKTPPPLRFDGHHYIVGVDPADPEGDVSVFKVSDEWIEYMTDKAVEWLLEELPNTPGEHFIMREIK